MLTPPTKSEFSLRRLQIVSLFAEARMREKLNLESKVAVKLSTWGINGHSLFHIVKCLNYSNFCSAKENW